MPAERQRSGLHRRRLAVAMLAALAAWFTGCAAERANLEATQDEQYGHRYAQAAGGRITLEITPADSTREFLFYPAYVESLHVRQGRLDTTDTGEVRAPVELLVKGSFADDCTELHSAEQWRAGHIVHLDLLTRRPRAVECFRVERPFRFYLPLEGLYGTGDYILKVGEVLFTFRIAEPAAEGEAR